MSEGLSITPRKLFAQACGKTALAFFNNQDSSALQKVAMVAGLVIIAIGATILAMGASLPIAGAALLLLGSAMPYVAAGVIALGLAVSLLAMRSVFKGVYDSAKTKYIITLVENGELTNDQIIDYYLRENNIARLKTFISTLDLTQDVEKYLINAIKNRLIDSNLSDDDIRNSLFELLIDMDHARLSDFGKNTLKANLLEVISNPTLFNDDLIERAYLKMESLLGISRGDVAYNLVHARLSLDILGIKDIPESVKILARNKLTQLYMSNVGIIDLLESVIGNRDTNDSQREAYQAELCALNAGGWGHSQYQ